MIISYLEFYSGVGGWSFSLKEAIGNLQKTTGGVSDVKSECLGAYDHSDLCNKVFHYNFNKVYNSDDNEFNPSRRISKKRKKRSKAMKTVSIESLTKEQLEEKSALIWMMSPPCQPHTRQHVKQDLDIQDPRSKSFMHLCDMISRMETENLPKIILLENVVGFEKSNSCRLWRKALRLRKYSVSHFHLNPTQCKLPNDRPRYYACAVLLDNVSSNSNSIPEEIGKKLEDSILHEWFRNNVETGEDSLDNSPPIRTNIKPLNICHESDDVELIPLSEFLDKSGEEDESKLYVPEKILKSGASWCFDIVTPSDRRSACFTSSYGKFVRGTGSVIAENIKDTLVEKFRLVPPSERKFDKDWADGLEVGDLRYFSGTEVARLFGFPVDPIGEDDNHQQPIFRFPPDLTLKQQWKLLGNSLNVKVTSKICEIALRMLLGNSKSM